MQIKRAQAILLLSQSEGKILSIQFTKKDGSKRLLNGRLGVTKYLKKTGNSTSTKQLGYTTVYDFKAKGYRTVDLRTIKTIKAFGETFSIR